MVRTKKQVVEALSKNKVNDQRNADSNFDINPMDVKLKAEIALVSANPSLDLYKPMSPPSPVLNKMSKDKATGVSVLHRSLLPTTPDSSNHRQASEMIWCSPAAISASPFASTRSYRNLVESKEKLHSLFSNLSAQEITEMLIDCGYDEDEVILRLITQANYLEYIRVLVYQRQSPQAYTGKHSNHILPSSFSNVQIRAKSIPERSKVTSPSRTFDKEQQQQEINKAPVKLLPSEQTEIVEKGQTNSQNNFKSNSTKSQNHRKRSKGGGAHRTGRLLLDDALQQVQNNKEANAFAGWSKARIMAFRMMDKNPNGYYYRFNAPGEQQSKGKWTDEERDLFMNRLKELGANQQWGIFSMAIPGRVGYQCSNYYRQMIQSGEIKDPNYVVDEKGKAHYLFDKKNQDGYVEKIFRKHSKHGSAPVIEEVPNKTANQVTPAVKQKKRHQYISDNESEDETFTPTNSKTNIKTSKKRKQKKFTDNHDGLIETRMTRNRYQKEQSDHVVPHN